MTWLSRVFGGLTVSRPPAPPTPKALAAPAPAVSTVDDNSDIVVLPDGLPPISRAAVDLIISYEVTDLRTYERRHAWPMWPGASSGVMIGIGHDLDYVTAAEATEDWACLPAARGMVRGLSDVNRP